MGTLPERQYATLLALIVMAQIARGIHIGTAGAEPPRGEAVTEGKQQVDYSRLVDSLVNRNHPPELVGDEDSRQPLFPEQYDWGEQARITRVISSLVAHPQESWQFLIEHLTDSRYSITLGREDPYNAPVGAVCSTILGDTLAAAYIPHIPSTRAAHMQLSRPPVARSDDFGKWLRAQEAKHRPLFELQIEMCEWALKKIDELGKTEILGVPMVSGEERAASVAKIRRQIAELKAAKKPRPMDSFMMLGEGRIPYSKQRADKIRASLSGGS